MTIDDRSTAAAHKLLDDPLVAHLLDASVDAMVVLGGGQEIVWSSPATVELLGWTHEEIRSLGPLALVHPEDLPAATELLGMLLAGEAEDEPHVILRLRRKDAEPLWVEIKGADLRHAPGIDGVILTARDVSHRLDLELALRESQRRFEALVRNSNDAIVVLDPEMRLTYASPAVEGLSGYPAEVMMGQEVARVIQEPGRSELLEAFDRVRVGEQAIGSVRVRIRHRSGGSRWLEVRVSNHLADPAVAGMIANVRDISDVVAAEDEAQRLIEIFDLTADLVTVVDGESLLLYMNPACQRFFGFSDDELSGLMGRLWRVGEVADRLGGRDRFEQGERSWSDDVMLTAADGRRIPYSVQVIAHTDADGDIVRFSAIAHDVSESKDLQATLERQATHDALTGLPNRTMLEQRLADPRVATDGATALLFLDLDRFKVINDSLGHEFGDRLLQIIADRLRQVVRPGDTVARFGGDEFVVLCEIIDRAEAAEVSQRLLQVIGQPVTIDGHRLSVSASIGIAIVEDRSATLDSVGLIRDADTAMYRAKADGRSRTVVFDEHLRRRAVDRQHIESTLQRAADDGSLELRYQPIVELGTGKLVALEALVRWRHGDELVPPSEFIPLAEETGLILPIGEWVLDTACADLARWQHQDGWSHLGMTVNASVRQLQHVGFADVVERTLDRHGVHGRSLMLEITESVFFDDSTLEAPGLRQLRELEVGLAIDDFGTGYSSLTYMSRLPVDVVKLDRTFLCGVGVDPLGATLVAAVLDLVRALGYRCVAEGIETAAQYSELTRLGCDAGQGYYVARPMTATAIDACLRGVHPDASWPRGAPEVTPPRP